MITRKFDSWETTCCDECGHDFQVTRSEPKTVDGPVICGDCEMYQRGYRDGYETGIKVQAVTWTEAKQIVRDDLDIAGGEHER